MDISSHMISTKYFFMSGYDLSEEAVLSELSKTKCGRQGAYVFMRNTYAR